MSSAICLNFDQSKILSSGKEFRMLGKYEPLFNPGKKKVYTHGFTKILLKLMISLSISDELFTTPYQL